jgi:CHAD domain-containing protein
VTEREVKLAAAPSFRLPQMDDAVDGLRAEDRLSIVQHTTYYDTPDLRLARWGASLRYRDTDGWTVKLPVDATGDVLVREEIRFPGGPKHPPDDALDLLRAYVRTETVAPVTRMRTVRHAVVLHGPDDEPVAEVVDDEVSVMNGRRLAARFRELEVEALDGTTDETLEEIVALLRAAGAGEPDPTPKYVRALGPRSTEAPEVAVSDLPSGASAAAVVKQAFAASVIRLLRHDVVVRLDADPEGVHQARVATRRLRSDLRTFKALLDEAWVADLVDDLRWLADRLGAARDADVMLARLRKRVNGLERADQTPGERLLEQVEQQQRIAHDELLAVMRDPRYAEVLDRLVDTALRPALLLEADLPAPAVLPRMVRKPWKKLMKAVEALGEDPTDEELHRVRIKAKRLRYASEAVAPLMGKPARELAEAASTLQDVLGDHNDAVVAGRWLRDVARRSRSVRTAFVAGELGGLEQWSAAETREAWPAAWKRLKSGNLRDWM